MGSASHDLPMQTVILGSEALADGKVTRGQLRWKYRALFPDVYQPRIAEPTLYARTVGAWLWSGQRGVITGKAASALHGARWVDEDTAIELIWKNHHPPQGIITRDERFTSDQVVEINGMAVASIHRTAFDLGRFSKRDDAVKHLDALAHATGVASEHILPFAHEYKGARWVRRLREAVALMDAGAQSPKETWLRLVLIDAGLPRPTTQIPVYDDDGYPFAYLDIGWEDIKVAVEYDGDQHRTDRSQYVKDIARLDKLQRRGWIVIRVIAEDRPYEILRKVREAFRHRETEGMAVKRRA
jgi:hypothetical protein